MLRPEPQRTHRTRLGTARWCFYDLGSGCRARLLRCSRCRIEFAIALLDPPRANMALHRDADMVWAIAGTCRVKFLSSFAGGQGKNALPGHRADTDFSTSTRIGVGHRNAAMLVTSVDQPDLLVVDHR